MSRVEILYLLPYLGSLALSQGVLTYAWQRRRAKGAASYLWYVAGQTLWVFGFIFKLLSEDISGKIFWDGTQWLAGLFVLITFPVFAVQYTEHKLDHPRRLFALSLTIPILFTLMLTTDSVHHLIYRNPTLLSTVPFPELSYEFTWVVYGYAVYGESGY